MSTARNLPRLGAAVIAPLIAAGMLASPAVASSAEPGGCTDERGVTVVVDFTDLGGDIVAGCADLDPSSGREALEASGFAITESQPGLICAIDDRPDPCPAAFDGSFWSYWHAAPGGDWTSYLVGADSSDPAPGGFEGWRYNDGSTGPGLAPADVAAALPSAPDIPATDDVEPSTSAPPVDATSLLAGAGIGALVILAVILLLLRSRRRGAGGGGPGAESDDDGT